MNPGSDKEQQWSKTSELWSNGSLFIFVCVLLQAAEMVEDEVDPDSQSWGGMRGESETVSDVKVLTLSLNSV